MPVVSSAYKSPFYLFNAHLQTVVPSIFRKVPGTYQRERLELPDGDFLDLDWITNQRNKLVIISHGLEGNSERHYAKGMAKHFVANGWDALAWNCRGCSGEMNRLPRFYHHGATEDLAAIVNHAIQKHYEHIVLVGFSMGGSMTLKYLGEQTRSAIVKCAIAFSVPCDLGSSAAELDKAGNKFYLKRFLKKLELKIRAKAIQFPHLLSASGFETITSFREFDTRYTAPLHGFADANDFYTRASCNPFLNAIQIPVLLVNAQNDPFLPQSCYPIDIAKAHPYLSLEMPACGGHVGFSLYGKTNWMEIRALEFANSIKS
ncbi:MAG: alpha/beta fold hydrolase [Cyclobacteriaceae bacterium]|nr:alpha/beta fold hydrolase [Cyclobacteriaceae bacterium]